MKHLTILAICCLCLGYSCQPGAGVWPPSCSVCEEWLTIDLAADSTRGDTIFPSYRYEFFLPLNASFLPPTSIEPCTDSNPCLTLDVNQTAFYVSDTVYFVGSGGKKIPIAPFQNWLDKTSAFNRDTLAAHRYLSGHAIDFTDLGPGEGIELNIENPDQWIFPAQKTTLYVEVGYGEPGSPEARLETDSLEVVFPRL
ncbi:MAG: hypothetical protein AAFR61_16855 [Bacteroidota bacterium]